MVTRGLRLTLIFSALGDPTRRGLLDLLRHEAQPVHVLAGPFPMSRPAISRHLRLLKEAGLVLETKQGRERLYSLRPEALKEIQEWATGMGRGSAGTPVSRSQRGASPGKRRSASVRTATATSRAPKTKPQPQPGPAPRPRSATKQRQPSDDWQAW